MHWAGNGEQMVNLYSQILVKFIIRCKPCHLPYDIWSFKASSVHTIYPFLYLKTMVWNQKLKVMKIFVCALTCGLSPHHVLHQKSILRNFAAY